jgi:hypothetical protein
MTEIDSDIKRLHEDFADRLRVLGAMFTDLGTEKGAERLLGSLVADDAGEFHALIDGYDLPDFPKLGKCVWVREVLDSVLITPNVEETCSILATLTPHQRVMVLAIARKHEVFLIEPVEGQAVAPSPFLDDLKANNLVTCPPTGVHVRPLSLLGPYERFCV